MLLGRSSVPAIPKLKTHIPGFDLISCGGLPRARTTLLSGPAGGAKSVFAVQFLAEGIRRAEENGVFVTFEASPEDIRRDMTGLGFDIAAWEAQGRWAFVDASPRLGDFPVVSGDYDFGALLARIEYAARRVGAKRLSLDSLGAIFIRFEDRALVRAELARMTSALKAIGVTALMTAERAEERGDIARFGDEEFEADNVIVLRDVLEEGNRRRTVEILNFRGALSQKGEHPFTILPGKGVVVAPLAVTRLKQGSSSSRVTSGVPELDQMCAGGFFRDSIILLSGATGTGKTLVASQFIRGGTLSGEKCLLFAFEESREQLFRNAAGWGVEYERMEAEGRLKVVCESPEVTGLEERLLTMKDIIDEFKPGRVAVDSLSALERVSTLKGFREFVIELASFIKRREALGLFTSATPALVGGASVPEAPIAALTDSIILLRYVELFGEMRRAVTILKMRGSRHDKDIREFFINEHSLDIGKPFRNVSGMLTGAPRRLFPSEFNRLNSMFQDDEAY